MKQKTKNIINWVLIGLVTFVFIGSAIVKLTGSEQAMKGAISFGISMNKLKLLGVVEVISVLLFIVPRTGMLGTLLLAAYMGGAIATHLEHRLPLFTPIIIQCLVWITAAIRFPELGKRFISNNNNGLKT